MYKFLFLHGIENYTRKGRLTINHLIDLQSTLVVGGKFDFGNDEGGGGDENNFFLDFLGLTTLLLMYFLLFFVILFYYVILK